MKLFLALLILSVIVLAGCQEADNGSQRVGTHSLGNDLVIYTLCVDNVICYYHPGGYAGGMDCFRDDDLVTKYCG
jgi:hypothetical protein